MKPSLLKVVRGLAIGIIAVAAVYSLWALLDEVSHGNERRKRQGVRQMIAEVRAGTSDQIRLQERFETNEFVKAIDEAAMANGFTLSIEYVGGVDDFLNKIRGCRGIKRLHLMQAGVTDAGMEHIATLPDCEELMLYHVLVTDVGIEKLVTAPKLASLELASYKKVSVLAVLSLPQLRRLTLFDTYSSDPDESIATEIDDFGKAQSLSELTLLGVKMSPEAVKSLRSRLPKCRIRAYARIAGRDKHEIAPIEP